MSMGSIWHEGEARSMSAMVLPFNASSPGSAAASVWMIGDPRKAHLSYHFAYPRPILFAGGR
ncbi:uncharacterized protein BDCG_17865 [Blastomyces dermatitidis ER-3]|uniref:Uncharacterized protein n=2 Tax=Blastomyces TaxID=229219 RepID=A0A179UUV5_BLAGS|nr:uncharacterized protein BDBG_17595 [Blastomyces gilchristii SLH14081]XP_045282697.1 uncharacterized protein BDCG_17865 [Blastomyces dermatitidis ER-3]OAT02970.1 hypothetical protein BDCG_17865 [Blastomyces dermatitidis ER-3]OAT11906.1 hypothetical protein BDBG_17595 [Blastomyces gilchristii SLH14081]